MERRPAHELAVFLVRHGESVANRENRIVSHRGDPELTPEGLREVQALANLWRDAPVTAVYSSRLSRTRTTAEAFLPPGQQVHIDDRLHEIGLGRWDGRIVEDIEREERERYHAWKADPELGAPEGGEKLSEVAQRMQAFLDAVRSQYAAPALIVAATHSDCLKAVALSILGAPWNSAEWLHLTNLAGLYLVWRARHWQLMMHPMLFRVSDPGTSV
ncbi:MAG: histidine phosphatase family protein [Firmicutes bacterium]|nr:histidine phosphatase family protein [Bacillota bacterium]